MSFKGFIFLIVSTFFETSRRTCKINSIGIYSEIFSMLKQKINLRKNSIKHWWLLKTKSTWEHCKNFWMMASNIFSAKFQESFLDSYQIHQWTKKCMICSKMWSLTQIHLQLLWKRLSAFLRNWEENARNMNYKSWNLNNSIIFLLWKSLDFLFANEWWEELSNSFPKVCYMSSIVFKRVFTKSLT
jgi:hypothetical protein